ncbi:MAG: TPM domain-containing protein [Actinobacteria bacterium]|nr:TPM domain-containing protein [Actinomycetota bacterium]
MKYKKSFSILTSLSFLFVILSLLYLVSFITSCSSESKDILSSTSINKARSSGNSENIFPEYNGFVNDFTNTLDNSWKTKTEQYVQSVEKTTGCEIGIAIINDLNGLTIEDYAVKLFEKWGIGKKYEDNGVLLLVSMNDRELRIEVGYGLEATITDLEAKEIIDDIITPRFKKNDYNSGIYNGVIAISNEIYAEQGKSENTYSDNVKKITMASFVASAAFPVVIILITLLPWFIISGLFGIPALIYFIISHRCPRCNKIRLNIKRIILKKPTFENTGEALVEKTCRYCGFHEIKNKTIPKLSKTSRTGGGSSFSSGSSSGGFHSSGSSGSSGFGGGSSGGGGASGRW